MIKFIKRYKWRFLIVALLTPVVFFFLWREYRVWSIPDIGEPFDVEAFLEPYKDEKQNGLVNYVEAAELFVPWNKIDPSNTQASPIVPFSSDADSDSTRHLTAARQDWRYASPSFQKYLEANLPVIEKFREGAGKRFATNNLPNKLQEQLGLVDLTSSWRELRLHSQNLYFSFWDLTLLRASQLTFEGDVEGAWDCHLSLLQAETQTMHRGFSDVEGHFQYKSKGFMENRSVLDRFLSHQELSAQQLRKMYQDVLEIYESLPPDSTLYQWEYVDAKSHLEELQESHEVDDVAEKVLISLKEVDVLLRFMALWTHAQMQQCDLPDDERPQLHANVYPAFLEPWNPFGMYRGKMICYPFEGQYEQQGVTYTQQDLESAYRTLIIDDYSEFNYPQHELLSSHLLRKEFQLDLLVIALQCYFREQGKYPEKLEELVPDYVSEIPDHEFNPYHPFVYKKQPEKIELYSQQGGERRQVITPGMKYLRPPVRAEKSQPEIEVYTPIPNIID